MASNSKSKTELRELAKSKRDSLDGAFCVQAAQAAVQIFAKEIDCRDKRIALYTPIGSEMDALALSDVIVRGGGTLCLPVVRDAQEMDFCAFDGDVAQLAKGPFGILEPQYQESVVPDIVVLPLLGFDETGNRLGWGKAFYDRALAKHDQPILCIGLAFSVQAFKTIPAEPHDIKLDAVISEKEMIRFS